MIDYLPNRSGWNGPDLRRQGAVIYLTLLMRFAVRSSCALLAVWLTAAASLPACCWSIAYAHDHQTTQGAASSSAAEHHHHAAGDAAAEASQTPTVYGPAKPQCDAESADVVVTTGRPTRIDVRAALAFAPVIMVPQSSASLAALSDPAPPGAPPDSAFLNPLRI